MFANSKNEENLKLRMLNAGRKFLRGFFATFDGLYSLRYNYALSHLAILPFLLSALFCFGFLWLGSEIPKQISEWLLQLLTEDPSFAFFVHIKWVLRVLLWAVFTLWVGLVSVFLLSAISAPFFALLAERVIVSSGWSLPSQPSWMDFFRWQLKMFTTGIHKSLYLLGLGLVAFVVGIIPGLQPLALLMTALMLSYDVMDYSYEAVGLEWPQRQEAFRSLFWEHLGLGSFLVLCLFLPGLLILLYPSAVVGAASVYASSGRISVFQEIPFRKMNARQHDI